MFVRFGAAPYCAAFYPDFDPNFAALCAALLETEATKAKKEAFGSDNSVNDYWWINPS